MKKIVSIVLVAAMAMTMAVGCAGKAADTEVEVDETTTAAVAEETTAADAEETTAADTETPDVETGDYVDGLGDVKANDKYNFGFTISIRDQFLSYMEAAWTAECAKLGVNQTVVDANNNANTQISQVQTFASQDVDGIVVNLVNTDNTAEMVQAAGDIPVVFVNRAPSVDLEKGKATYCGSDENNSGRYQGEFLAEFFEEKGKTDVNIVLFQGLLGLQNTILRTESAKKALADAGINATYVLDDTAEWDRAKAMNKMQTFLGTNKEFDAVICNNDEMALGCIEAMRAAGVDLAEIPVVGIDATPEALNSIDQDELAFTVFQNPVGQGAGSARALTLMANGEEVDIVVDIPFEPVSKDNYKEYMK
ncbi:MAG: substrate-binding domain-containing protein [Fastidiosipilaceae bacterium]|jgi:inositol transport system substrate-binding protein